MMNSDMVVLETLLPEDIFRTLQSSGIFKEALSEQARKLLAMHLYQDRVLSLGKSARLAGMNLWEFIELISENKIPVMDYSEEELAAELAASKRLNAELGK
jgi:predicted HTH domain antitoxin